MVLLFIRFRGRDMVAVSGACGVNEPVKVSHGSAIKKVVVIAF